MLARLNTELDQRTPWGVLTDTAPFARILHKTHQHAHRHSFNEFAAHW